MDLLGYSHVLRRQRRIVAVGLMLTALAVLVLLLRVSGSGVEFRSSPVYIGESTLLVTQSGFPLGRSVLTEYIRAQGTGPERLAVPKFADASRMEYLASVYSRLVQSDAVRGRVERGPFRELGVDEEYTADQLTAGDGRLLPLVAISATGRSKERTVALANRAAAALQNYVQAQQAANEVPSSSRVELPVITRAEEAEVLKGMKLTGALMVGLLGIVATVFVAFSVDNIRRQRLFADDDAVGSRMVAGPTRSEQPDSDSISQRDRVVRAFVSDSSREERAVEARARE